MPTGSTEEIAAIPLEVEQETKGIASPLESAESDPVSIMADTTSRSFRLLPAPGEMFFVREGRSHFHSPCDLPLC